MSAPVVDELGGGRVRWGDELDVRELRTGEERGEIAGYLAKYATKSTEQAGGLLHRIDRADIDRARVRPHVRRYLRTGHDLHAIATLLRARSQPQPAAAQRDVTAIETDWNPSALVLRAGRAMSHDERIRIRLRDTDTALVGRPVRIAPEGLVNNETTLIATLDDGERVHLGDVASIGAAVARSQPRRDRRDPRLAACAHAFGYRGHCLTKSRRYSTTFLALRQAREAYVHEQLLARSRDATQRALAEAASERIASFEYAGIGHLTAADAYLAASAAARAREHRQLAREARAMNVNTGGGT